MPGCVYSIKSLSRIFAAVRGKIDTDEIEQMLCRVCQIWNWKASFIKVSFDLRDWTKVADFASGQQA